MKWAIVISRTVSKGMANMLSTLLEDKNVEVRTFDDLDDAERWVRAAAKTGSRSP